jgi:conjugal transfer pilin signal peptidase TrbI
MDARINQSRETDEMSTRPGEQGDEMQRDNVPHQATTNMPSSSPRLLLGVALLMALCLAMPTWLLTRPAPQPAIVAFDMKGTLDQFLAQSASQSLTETQGEQLAARFSAALEASLTHYQAEHQALILVSPSVVRGAPDITLTIQQDIATRMREGQP